MGLQDLDLRRAAVSAPKSQATARAIAYALACDATLLHYAAITTVRLALLENGDNRTKAARELGVSQMAMFDWLRKYPEIEADMPPRKKGRK